MAAVKDFSVEEKLVSLLTRSFAARDQLFAAETSELLVFSQRELRRLARVSYLAPDIIQAILEGRQPRTLQARALERRAALPLDWIKQRRLLGFAAN